MKKLKIISRCLLGLLFIAAGLNHFIHPDLYVQIMPPYLPWHLFLVYLSGFFQIVFGIMILLRQFTRLAAWGLIALLIAVFPANIEMALHPELFPAINPLGLWLRLPVQAVLIAWAYWYAKPEIAAPSVNDL